MQLREHCFRVRVCSLQHGADKNQFVTGLHRCAQSRSVIRQLNILRVHNYARDRLRSLPTAIPSRLQGGKARMKARPLLPAIILLLRCSCCWGDARHWL